MKKKIAPIVACLSIAMFGMSSAYAAFEGLSMMRMGAWEVDFSGNVNAFFTNGECDKKRGTGTVAHGLTCGVSGVKEDSDYGDVRDGLLPSWLNFYARTVTDGGIQTAVHLSFQPGTNTDSPFTEGLDGALGLNSANFRQVFLTFGNDQIGTFKLGRDLGLFGSDAILNDMTLLGVGSGAFGRGHTTLGRIGVGYLYADWKSQVQYTSPDFNGFKFTAAITDPWGVGSLANLSVAEGSTRVYSKGIEANADQEADTYGFEAKINYNTELGNGTSLGLWASYITQSVDFKSKSARDADADAYDIGAKVAFGNFDLVGYYYDGEGIGTTSFLLDGIDLNGQERDSDGYYLQARYRLPTGTLLGASIGESNLDTTAYDRRQLAEARDEYNLVETNESWILGVYHPLGEALNLVVEYTETEAEAHNGSKAEESTLALGAIMFF